MKKQVSLKVKNPGRSPVAYYSSLIDTRLFRAGAETVAHCDSADADLIVKDLKNRHPHLRIEVVGASVEKTATGKATEPAEKAEKVTAFPDPDKSSPDSVNADDGEDQKTTVSDKENPEKPKKKKPGRPKKQTSEEG